MAYQEPNDNEPDGDADEYRRQQMMALQQNMVQEQGEAQQPKMNYLTQGTTGAAASQLKPVTGAPEMIEITGAAKQPKPNYLNTTTGAANQQLEQAAPGSAAAGAAGALLKKITEARGVPAATSGATAGGAAPPAAAPGPTGPPKVSDPESVKQWVIAEAKRVGRPDIAGNPDYWVQQAIAHSDKGDGTVDTGYWSNRMQIANKGGGGAASAAMNMMPSYLGGAGPGNFSSINAVAPGETSDTMQKVLAELAASQTGQQSPLARRLQMQQLQDAQQPQE